MTVILVNEDNHGLLTVAKDYKSAVKFLIDNRWIEESMEVWHEDGTYRRLDEFFGEDVLDIITEEWNIDDFNNFWEGAYLLNEVKVYE